MSAKIRHQARSHRSAPIGSILRFPIDANAARASMQDPHVPE